MSPNPFDQTHPIYTLDIDAGALRWVEEVARARRTRMEAMHYRNMDDMVGYVEVLDRLIESIEIARGAKRQELDQVMNGGVRVMRRRVAKKTKKR